MQKITHFELLSNEGFKIKKKHEMENARGKQETQKKKKNFHRSKPLKWKVLNEPGVDKRIW
jgi:hypothetical protein